MTDRDDLRVRLLKAMEQNKFSAEKGQDKNFIRECHKDYKADFISKNIDFWHENKKLLISNLISGDKIEVKNIEPELIPILPKKTTEEGKLFRLARFNWSIPTSNGFGRRLRFLVWDRHHDALIGIIGLTDPVFNMRARDNYIGWDIKSREQRLVSVMDAFALGSLPPYNKLLGGKLVASLLYSDEIRELFSQRYDNSTGLISGERKQAKLAAITTTSVLGRSSVYNRLKLEGRQILKPIGYTSGFGHFHFNEELFSQLRSLVNEECEHKANSHTFGQGPNWKIRIIKDALNILGLNHSLVKHGFKREIYVSELYSNSLEHLCNGDNLIEPLTQKANVIGRKAVNRWSINRAKRFPDYGLFSPEEWARDVERNFM